MDATIKALESFPANIHLILGGKDKGSDYTRAQRLAEERVKSVYTIGAAAEKISRRSKEQPRLFLGDPRAAVRQVGSCKPGDVVLLAPACASFDQFQNYEQRGKFSRNWFAKLQSRKSPGQANEPQK